MYDTLLRKIMDMIVAKCPIEIVNMTDMLDDFTLIDKKYRKGDHNALVSLNSTLERALLDYKRTEITYEEQLEEAFEIEDIYRSADSKDWKV